MTAFTSGWAIASGGSEDVTSGYAQVTIASPSGSSTPAVNITRQASVYSLSHQLADAFDEAIPFTMFVDVPYVVDMVGTVQSNAGTSTVYVDPVFQFAAGFDGTGYQLSYSPNLISAVPEPCSAALWLAGMAGLAMARRRRAGACRRR